jgi:DNA-binding winged helix-turn-helix (wHTH) protein
LQPQPAKILTMLVSRAGEVVTRQELAQEVWGSDTFVDFEQVSLFLH